jgi:branched-chain amino acid transport system ATP-binding protein
MLALDRVDVYYGKARALEQVSVDIADGEIVCLVGRNGAGKTTVLRTLMGLLPCTSGRRLLDGVDVSGLKPHQISRAGVAYVPEDRQVFPNLTVDENLAIAGVAHPDGHWTRKRIYELFPRLQEREQSKGLSLSGGEQQMLAIARAVMTNPRILMLDEPCEGLAPLIVRDVRDAIVAINRRGVAVLLVEQKIAIPLQIGNRIYLIDHGKVGWQGKTEDFRRERVAIEQRLTV